MRHMIRISIVRARTEWAIIGLLVFLAGDTLSPAAHAEKLSVATKWGRFEQAFKSSVTYENPVQEATLWVVFTSPAGEKREVFGFWDGGRAWRVRFSPDQLGRWTYVTRCSDSGNAGLNGQSGAFLCTSPVGASRFSQHGPVRVARDRRHLEHADGTPFFWVADTTWDGLRVAETRDFQFYALTRANQGFTAIQWAVAPGANVAGQSAYGGFPERIAINPEYFQQLDPKVDMLSHIGLLSVISPLVELEGVAANKLPLSDSQAAVLGRYVMARYGAEPTAWLLAFDGDPQAKKIGRWRSIGQAMFGEGWHAPVVLFPGQTAWVLDEFRNQAWVDVFAFQSVTDTSETGLQWSFAGPLSTAWTKEPVRPMISVTPPENGWSASSKKRFSPDEVRRSAYWGLLMAPPAGISYSAQGVSTWDASQDGERDGGPGADLPLWKKSMFMPAAKQIGLLAGLMETMDFWQLRPESGLITTQPGDPTRHVAAATTASKDLILAYTPDDQTLALKSDSLPASPKMTWIKPVSGQQSPAVALPQGQESQVKPPGPGDWLLMVKPGR